MYLHLKLADTFEARKRKLGSLIHSGAISLGGYRKAKIYGLLSCPAGKRMKTENRVFFKDEKEAIENGYRPCGTCLPEKYKLWKASLFSYSNVHISKKTKPF
ncbi:MAG TPA: Ada metal-binding domain-containing protein [Pseudosphingobacterium sp.]|nr:Ada metal-binding domain-containing protein [Pseudosphingobacterium sp.]